MYETMLTFLSLNSFWTTLLVSLLYIFSLNLMVEKRPLLFHVLIYLPCMKDTSQ